MKTKLERQFFEAFGIVEYMDYICTLDVKCPEVSRCEECEHYNNPERKKYYPQITDTHYLKLICIYAQKFKQYTNYFTNIDEFRQEVLIDFINEHNNFDKHQIQALFEEN